MRKSVVLTSVEFSINKFCIDMRFEKTLALRVKVPDSFLYPCVSDFRLGQLTFPDIRNYLSEEPNVLGFGRKPRRN